MKRHSSFIHTPAACITVSISLCLVALPLLADENAPRRTYENRLTPLASDAPILADHPRFVHPVSDVARYEAPPLIDEEGANLAVRAWRWSYNARGIIEIPNRLRGDRTALIVVHPWGIDDGQGWTSPEPAGCAFQCTPIKNQLCRQHARTVIDPLLKRLRGDVKLVMYSLPGTEDPIRKQMYRSFRSRPSEADRQAGARELEKKLKSFDYTGQPLPDKLELSTETPVIDYFKQFPGLDAGDRFNHAGFWQLPIPVMKDIAVDPDDVVIYDAEGYAPLRDFLKQQGVQHILLAGYNTDMCVCKTTAGWENLRQDFNVFLVGDATIATFPANAKPAYATNAAVSFAALNLLITQASWVEKTK